MYCNPYLPSLEVAIERLKPFPHKVLLEVLERPDVFSPGSKILRDNSNYYSPSDRGVVLAVGEDLNVAVSPGDIVAFLWRKGDDFVCEGKHLLFLKEDELLAILGRDRDAAW